MAQAVERKCRLMVGDLSSVGNSGEWGGGGTWAMFFIETAS